jgi:hypothetical protein
VKSIPGVRGAGLLLLEPAAVCAAAADVEIARNVRSRERDGSCRKRPIRARPVRPGSIRGRELLAGASARKRTVETSEGLTAQEVQVARLAATACRTRRSTPVGSSIRAGSITALRKVLTKLAITSRTQLDRVLPAIQTPTCSTIPAGHPPFRPARGQATTVHWRCPPADARAALPA